MIHQLTPKERWVIIAVVLVLVIGTIVRYYVAGDPETP